MTPAKRFILLLGAVIPLAACSTKVAPAALRAYYACDYGKAMAELSPKAKEGGKDVALYNLHLLSASLAAGDYDTAERASKAAQSVMWNVEAGKGKGTASLVSAEAIKVFKGEPFEKAMASIYGGILYFNRGDIDNARASFSRAVMAIKMKEEAHRDDFALANLLQAKVFLRLGEDDNARLSLERVRKLVGENPLFNADTLKAANALFVIELGRGPEKVRHGPGASLAAWKRRDYPEQGAAVFVDGKEVGWAVQAGDLTYQAETKGKTAKDAVQVTKGVARDAAIVTTVIAADAAARGSKNAGWVALGAGLFALANQSQADIRQWDMLPDRLLVSGTKLPPGNHQIQVVFVDGRGNPITSYQKSWLFALQDPKEEKIFLVRAGPCPAGSNMAMSR